MTKQIGLAASDAKRLDLSFFSPCEVCAETPRNRAIVIRLGACPGACDHVRRVQQRLRGIRAQH